MARRKYTELDLRANKICIEYTRRMRMREIERECDEEFDAVVEKLSKEPDTVIIRDKEAGTVSLVHVPLGVRVKDFYGQLFDDKDPEERARDAFNAATVLVISEV